MRVHFMSIDVANLLVKNNTLIKSMSSYETTNNKKVISIFVKCNDEFVTLIEELRDEQLHIKVIMKKLIVQFANKS